MTRPLAASLCGGPCKSSRCSRRRLPFDCDGSLIDWKSCIFSALHSLIAAHHKTLSDAALDELYAEQADLIFDRPEICGCFQAAEKLVPEEKGETWEGGALPSPARGKAHVPTQHSAAVNRFAIRNQVQHRVFTQALC